MLFNGEIAEGSNYFAILECALLAVHIALLEANLKTSESEEGLIHS
jgi:hypothetical protein